MMHCCGFSATDSWVTLDRFVLGQFGTALAESKS
jgi:hypothetical protein